MRQRLGVVIAIAVLAADQASKLAVLDWLHLPELGRVDLLPMLSLTMVWNTGVTFGLLGHAGAAGPWLLAAGAVVVVVVLCWWLRRAETDRVAACIGAIIGGAIGNLLDRARFGAVVDFIHVHIGTWSWYVFNLADTAIVVAVGTLLLDGMRASGLSAGSPPRRTP